ncbi:DUF6264 family protein [Paramicrobacterium sp. CJ85]|uniref:DUF6264 family protein n=1 Tax=Paramicrobacterium sp. CJ85 TaxID=3445355 RepID=UPI003F60F7B6
MSDTSDREPEKRPKPAYGEYAERPKPQYGEYATPEQQRAAIRQPATDDNESVPIADDGRRTPEPARRDAPRPAPATPDMIAESRSRGDRIATFVLLGVGLVSVLTTLPSMFELPDVMTQAYAQFGIGSYTNETFANAMGWVILISHIILWVMALMLSLRRLAAGKIAWWVPFVIGVIANIIYIVVIVIVMVNDPAFSDYVTHMSQTG